VTTPRIYVGTYAKYNAGSIAGAWLDLEDYHTKADFLAAAAALHADEVDPELMYQDFEGFPREYYGESGLADELWDWLALDDDDRELLTVYRDHTGATKATIDDARENFQGRYDSPRAWAEEFLEDTHPAFSPRNNNREAELLVRYFDFDAYAHDAGQDSVVFVDTDDGEVLVFWR